MCRVGEGENREDKAGETVEERRKDRREKGRR